MTADIYVDLEQLKSEIIALNVKKLTEINQAMRSACNAVATLVAYGWSGEAKDAFMEKFTKHKNDMRIFYENMQEFNAQLRTIQGNGKRVISLGNKVATKL